jgi:hypothetical protein
MLSELFSKSLNTKIEIIPYSSDLLEPTLEVIRKSFFKNETVCIANQINHNLDAQKDLEKLVVDALEKRNVSVVARDVSNNKIVGAAINVIQVRAKKHCRLVENLNFNEFF